MLRNREGFAIPMSIMVIGFLTVGLMTAFARVDNDYKSATNRTGQIDAYSLATTGLERFLVGRTALGFTSYPPAPAESARITLTGGYADVISIQVRDTVGGRTPIYVIRSRGTTTPPRLTGSRSAQHTVAVYSNWVTGTMNVLSGWTALGGLEKNGGSGALSGIDGCNAKATLAGVTVPVGEYDGATRPAEGNPPIDDTRTERQLIEDVGIDWPGILAGAITPDLVIPGDAWPSFANPNYWPVIKVNGNFDLPSNGRGTLMVTGNLVLGGNVEWEGIILVGGALTDNGSGSSLGATVTGLNEMLGETVEVSSSEANGTKRYQYNSCNVAKASARFGTLVAMKNTWIDNWSWQTN